MPRPESLKECEVLVATDSRYVDYACFTLLSAAASLEPGWTLKATVINGGLTDVDRETIEQRMSAANVLVRLVEPATEIDGFNLSALPTAEHWSLAIYYRLWLGRYYPSKVERVIYLDADVLVRCSLSGLLAVDLAGKTLGAIENPLSVRGRQLGLKYPENYFNSGVLLFDLQRWRAIAAEARLLDVIRSGRHNLVFPDQDALNLVFDGDVKCLDPAWNVQATMFSVPSYFQSIDRAKIIHFTTHRKPWHLGDLHPFGAEYRRFMVRFPWGRQAIRAVPWLRRLRGCVRAPKDFGIYYLYSIFNRT